MVCKCKTLNIPERNLSKLIHHVSEMWYQTLSVLPLGSGKAPMKVNFHVKHWPVSTKVKLTRISNQLFSLNLLSNNLGQFYKRKTHGVLIFQKWQQKHQNFTIM